MIGVILLSGAGIVVGAGILADLVVSSLASRWEPLQVDRGEIVEADQ